MHHHEGIIRVRVQRNSSTVMRVWKLWTEEHRITRKAISGRRKVTSARDDRHLLRMAGNLNRNRYVHAVPQPEVVSFLQGIPGAIFQQDSVHPHVAKTVRDFCSDQHMQLLPCPVYSSDMSPIEHVWDLVGRCLARDRRPATSKNELLWCIQAMWNSLPQADIQNLFDSMPCRIAAIIAAHGCYTKY
ncbi:UNVERIFIED_CONTAM: tc1a [Trichonephila clavipes]